MSKRTKSELLDDLKRASKALATCKGDLRSSQAKCAEQTTTIKEMKEQIAKFSFARSTSESKERVVRKGRLEDEVEIARLRAENDKLRRGG